jgi:DNA-binding NarL/FixJ family response regulator
MKLSDKVQDGEGIDRPVKTGVIRVILADSQGIYRVGIHRILALEEDISLVALAGSFEELRVAIERQPADVVLVEGEILTGTPDTVPELQRISPGIKLIVQTESVEENQTVELYRRGIRGIVCRSISPDLLVRCIRRINSGETWIDNQALNWVISAYRAQETALLNPRPQVRLSPKETAIVTCITKGMRNKEIAFELKTTEQVVKNYLRKIYDKLGVADRLELALYSLQKKIVKAEVDDVAISQTTRQLA